MRASVNLTFDGGCAEALALYARLLGATVTFSLRYGDTPMAAEVPAEWPGRIAHATITLDDADVLGGGVRPGGRSLRHRVGDQLRAGAGVTVRTPLRT